MDLEAIIRRLKSADGLEKDHLQLLREGRRREDELRTGRQKLGVKRNRSILGTGVVDGKDNLGLLGDINAVAGSADESELGGMWLGSEKEQITRTIGNLDMKIHEAELKLHKARAARREERQREKMVRKYRVAVRGSERLLELKQAVLGVMEKVI